VERSGRGERKEALQAVEEALKADPQSARAFKVKAEILAYTGKFDAALPEMKRACRSNKDEGIYGLRTDPVLPRAYSDAMSSFRRRRKTYRGSGADLPLTCGSISRPCGRARNPS